MPEPAQSKEADASDQAADEAIAACGGDLRATIKALVVANQYLEAELDAVIEAVSQGYARGRIGPRRSGV